MMLVLGRKRSQQVKITIEGVEVLITVLDTDNGHQETKLGFKADRTKVKIDRLGGHNEPKREYT